MSKLMTNKLASDFSWVGLKKKEVFSKSKIAELVICKSISLFSPNLNKQKCYRFEYLKQVYFFL